MARKKNSSPTVSAVRSEAKRMNDGAPTTPSDNTAAAQRKAMLRDVPSDLRKQGRREETQSAAADRDHSNRV
ncbi:MULTISPECIES: hypothetical protein [unclassified Streptomyces]|uniref:hypothetical protein n=1 Tax=unclassified Streptomyces TaxID=2593676 RepID=UPI000823BE97|nr:MULTISPECIES: hypothetical protein [unclassified Streptomyces]MYT96839.1 hypothetical protein [Streptomyces sp. SID8350]SCK63160.1 hypothetical protein YUWDRAFT_06825 [Streptomyces sp. AmelKG-D3]